VTVPGVHKSVLETKPQEGFASAVGVAVALHVALLVAFVELPKLFDRPPPLRKPVIAHLVALGKPRDKSLLPRKELPPPPGGGPVTAPVAAKPGASRPAPVAKAAKPQRQPSRQELMEKALARAAGRAREDAPETDPDRPGQENGSPEGSAEASEAGDAYFTAIHDAIQANYVVPSVVSERERMALSATVLVYIGAQGQMLKHELQKPSGNPLIDSALEAALRKTQLPPPPKELARLLRDEGVLLNFHP
jgi:outer membrane biosynthesis protein TonB